MALKAQGSDLVIAVVLLVIGIAVLVGQLSVGFLVPLLGIALIVLGILILLGIAHAQKVWGIAALVLGLLLQLDYFGVPRAVTQVLDLAVGVILVIVGALKLTGK